MLGDRFLQNMWLCLIATRFIFETEKHNGIAELLEILGRLVHCVIMVFKKPGVMCISYAYNNNNRFTALCPGLPGSAGTRRNTHPPTILIVIQSLSASSIYRDL